MFCDFLIFHNLLLHTFRLSWSETLILISELFFIFFMSYHFFSVFSGLLYKLIYIRIYFIHNSLWVNYSEKNLIYSFDTFFLFFLINTFFVFFYGFFWIFFLFGFQYLFLSWWFWIFFETKMGWICVKIFSFWFLRIFWAWNYIIIFLKIMWNKWKLIY